MISTYNSMFSIYVLYASYAICSLWNVNCVCTKSSVRSVCTLCSVRIVRSVISIWSISMVSSVCLRMTSYVSVCLRMSPYARGLGTDVICACFVEKRLEFGIRAMNLFYWIQRLGLTLALFPTSFFWALQKINRLDQYLLRYEVSKNSFRYFLTELSNIIFKKFQKIMKGMGLDI